MTIHEKPRRRSEGGQRWSRKWVRDWARDEWRFSKDQGSGCSFSTAFFVFFAAVAGAWFVATDFGRGDVGLAWQIYHVAAAFIVDIFIVKVFIAVPGRIDFVLVAEAEPTGAFFDGVDGCVACGKPLQELLVGRSGESARLARHIGVDISKADDAFIHQTVGENLALRGKVRGH